jgi:hypothetical protein
LPSGATILAVKPEPLEWILSGRIPQNLLGAALEAGPEGSRQTDRAMTRQEIVDLAAFARQLVEASVVEPPIGDGPGEMPMDEIPVKDRAFIFEWACRALKDPPKIESRKPCAERSEGSKLEEGQSAIGNRQPAMEGLSSQKLGRFREK